MLVVRTVNRIETPKEPDYDINQPMQNRIKQTLWPRTKPGPHAKTWVALENPHTHDSTPKTPNLNTTTPLEAKKKRRPKPHRSQRANSKKQKRHRPTRGTGKGNGKKGGH